MANEKNLKPLTTEKAREIGRKGGIASGKAKKARKTLKEELLALLEAGDTQKNISLAMIQQALEGNTKAFEVIRDTVGEKPVDALKLGNENEDKPFEVNINVVK